MLIREVKEMKIPDSLEMSAGVNPEKYRAFLLHECHYNSYTNPNAKTGAIGGAMSYSFSPTSLGTAIQVKCACGKLEDISDYENW